MACTVQGCQARARARGWCNAHYIRWQRHGDPGADNTAKGERNAAWKGASASYEAAHLRVRAAHGPATEHACRFCGSPALQWAYDHNDPAETTLVRQGRAVTFSHDPSHYLPLCRPCHLRLDERRLELMSA